MTRWLSVTTVTLVVTAGLLTSCATGARDAQSRASVAVKTVRAERPAALRRPGPDRNLPTIPAGVPDTPGLAESGSIWFPSIVFSPTNEWVEKPGGDFLRVTAGFVPDGPGAVVVVTAYPCKKLRPGDPKPLHLFRAPAGVGRLEITRVEDDTVQLVTTDGRRLTFDVSAHRFTVGPGKFPA